MSENTQYAIMPLEDYTNICDKIREKTGVASVIKSSELTTKVEEVYSIGYEDGTNSGGYNEGYEAGQSEKEREMWDTLTNNNTRTEYEKGFVSYGGEFIRPPYKICPTSKNSANQTFSGAKNLKKIEAAYFDFSQKVVSTESVTGVHYTFYHCESLEELEDIGLPAPSSYAGAFNGCANLRKIALLRVNENTKYGGAFPYCNNLEYVTFEGVIGQNGLDLHWSTKLSKASWYSIINALSTTTTGLSITGSLTSVKKAFETSEGANDGNTSEEWLALIATKSNWTISLA